MNETLSKIRTRGYWEVVLHPGNFVANRVSKLSELWKAAEDLSVRFRGWDFPHIDRDGPTLGTDWIESAIDWSNYVELWRFYQTGQFVYFGGLRTDWYDQAHYETPTTHWKVGLLFPVGDTIYRFTEIFEFASRLAIGPLQADTMIVSIRVVGLKDRQLFIDNPNRSGFSFPRAASIDEYPLKYSLPTAELTARTRELAVSAAEELFARFNWEPGADRLRQWQDELFRP